MTAAIFNEEAMSGFARQLRSSEFRQFWQSRVAYEVAIHYAAMENHIEESLFGLRLLKEFHIENKKVLEIGVGAGILTAWLLKNGVDAWGIEPAGTGYGFHANVFSCVQDFFNLPSERIIDAAAEDLKPSLINNVDLIFSVNVLEHIQPQNLPAAFAGMKSVLAHGGGMLHHCPNYLIPYEPHYGLPLVPFFPHLTGKLKGVYKQGVWQSLNFITYFKVKKLAADAGLVVQFKKGLMAVAFERLEKDEVYASRHYLLKNFFPVLKYSGILWAMRHIPPSLCTPMTFYLRVFT